MPPRFSARLLAGALGVGPAALLHHTGATAQDVLRKIAIVPFSVSGDPELAGMGDFVPDLLASRLEGRGSFAFADTAPRRGTLPPKEKGLLSQDRAADLASRLGGVSPTVRCPRPAAPEGARMVLVRAENDPRDPSVAGPILVGLRWSGTCYTEAFRLGEFRSKLTDFQWRDLDGDGTSEVLVCLVSPYTEGRESRIEVWRPGRGRR